MGTPLDPLFFGPIIARVRKALGKQETEGLGTHSPRGGGVWDQQGLAWVPSWEGGLGPMTRVPWVLWDVEDEHTHLRGGRRSSFSVTSIARHPQHLGASWAPSECLSSCRWRTKKRKGTSWTGEIWKGHTHRCFKDLKYKKIWWTV